MANMIFAGFGGQGVLTAGLIVAKTAMNCGDEVTWIPSYGSEMRGGTANCTVKISSEKISSPFVRDIDILVAMNVPSLDKFLPLLREGGTAIVNSSLIPKDYPYNKDIQVISVDATGIASELENPKGSSIVAIGALIKSGLAYNRKTMENSMISFFEDKGKGKFNRLNEKCLNVGYERCKIHKLMA